jgi:hypothetical protein
MSGWCALGVLLWGRLWLYQKLSWAAGALLTSSLHAESVSDSIVSRHHLVTGFAQVARYAGRVYGLLAWQ